MVRNGVVADDTAVSPVIGVILMVAITVILAAVVGSFALGLPDQVEPDTEIPETSFKFEYDSSATGTTELASSDSSGSVAELTIIHESGDTIDSSNIEIQDDDGDGPETFSSPSELTAGTSISVNLGSDDKIKIVYVPDGVDTSAIIAEYEGPDA